MVTRVARRPHPVRAVMTHKGLTVREVAADIGMNETVLNRVLNRSVAPWPKIRARLVAYFDLPEDQLFDEVDDDPPFDRVAASRAAQGLPPRVTDPGVLRAVAEIAKAAHPARDAG